MANQLVEDLRQQIADRNAVVIVGAGTSIAATRNARTASWTGLLDSGVDRCEALLSATLKQGWGDRVRAEIDSGDLDDLLSAAGKIESKLGAPDGGEYARWLRETVGVLKVKDPSVPEALCGLKLPLCTTNYDGLLEQQGSLRPVTWRDTRIAERVLRGDERGVLHLHGYWEQPESVILGVRSYEQVMGADHVQALMRALRMTRTLVFVGCGAGLADPNWEALGVWIRRVFAGSHYRHYRLERDGDVQAVQRQHPPEERLFVIGYGPEYSDLAPFLQGLASGAWVPARVAPARDRIEAAVEQYRARMALQYRSNTLEALAARAEDRDIPEGLDRLSLFVPQTVRRSPPEKDMPRWTAGRPDRDMPLVDALTDPDVPWGLYLGAPGAGKSEMTAWLMAKLCTEGETLPEGLAGLIPLHVQMSRFDEAWQARAAQGQDYDFMAFAAADTKLSVEALCILHDEARLLWLFDGLDEVRNVQLRNQYARMIADLCRAGKGRGLTTSRIVGSEFIRQTLAEAGLAVCTVLEFNDQQIGEFIARWHERAFPADPEKGQRRRRRLETAIAESIAIRELCKNPLLLTLVALLNRGDELPRRRHLVYQRAMDLMVSQWEANKHLPPDSKAVFEREDKLRFLRELAWAMQQDHLPQGSGNLVHQQALHKFTLGFCIRHWGLDEEAARSRAELLLSHLRERNYALALVGPELFGFVHKTFLEFLAAEAVVRFENEEKRASLFREHWRQDNWREVLTLCCGLLDERDQPDRVARMLLTVLSGLSLRTEDILQADVFVLSCLGEVRHLQLQPIRAFVEQFGEVLRHDIVRFAGAFLPPGLFFELNNWLPGTYGDDLLHALRLFEARWPDAGKWQAWATEDEIVLRMPATRIAARSCAIFALGLEHRIAVLATFLVEENDLNTSSRLVETAAELGSWSRNEVACLLTLMGRTTDQSRLAIAASLLQAGVAQARSTLLDFAHGASTEIRVLAVEALWQERDLRDQLLAVLVTCYQTNSEPWLRGRVLGHLSALAKEDSSSARELLSLLERGGPIDERVEIVQALIGASRENGTGKPCLEGAQKVDQEAYQIARQIYRTQHGLDPMSDGLKALAKSSLNEESRKFILSWLEQPFEDVAPEAEEEHEVSMATDSASSATSEEKRAHGEHRLIKLAHSAQYERNRYQAAIGIARFDENQSRALLTEFARAAQDENVRLGAAQALADPRFLSELARTTSSEEIRQGVANDLKALRLRAALLEVGRSHRRRAIVSCRSTRAGILEETDTGSRFIYDLDWLTSPDATPIALTLPLQIEPFETRGLHPFFENLLPEGIQREQASRDLGIPQDDSFGLLLGTGADLLGAVEVVPEPEARPS